MTKQETSSQGSSVASDSVTIVNLDATNEEPVVKFFKAGTYEVRVIGKSQGGRYEAWSRWENNDTYGTFITGWLNAYTIYSPEFKEIDIGDINQTYETKEAALAAAKTRGSSTFTLNSDGEVKFYLKDEKGKYKDNRDGLSLAVKKKGQATDNAPLSAGVSFLILVIVVLFSVTVWGLANLVNNYPAISK